MPDTAPLKKTLDVESPAVAAASDGSLPVGEAPYNGTVASASYTPVTTITGANTDTRTIAIVNKGSGGAGTTGVASLAFTSGVNASAYDEKAMTLSATAANLTVNAGDILAFTSTHAGSTGLADPGGLVQIEISRS